MKTKGDIQRVIMVRLHTRLGNSVPYEIERGVFDRIRQEVELFSMIPDIKMAVNMRIKDYMRKNYAKR